MISIIGGFLAGLFHRYVVSPFAGKQTYTAQSVGTPAAGIIIGYLPFSLSLNFILRKTIPDKRIRHDIMIAAGYSYWTTFLYYGLAVVLTILARKGGVKK